jgi:hypothetical protein
MRTIPAAVSLLSLAALAACGNSDEAARKAFREGSLSSCVEASRGRPAPPGFDWERLCTCATDRVMEGKSGRELAQMQPGTPEQRRIVEQCVAELQGQAPKAGG